MTSWEKPLPFIETVDGRLVVNKFTAEKLDSIEKPMVIVCIAGLGRTGKSYLMNRLAGKTSGFSTGSSLDSHTKGFWVWCVDHPLHPTNCLLLIDTAGSGDPFGHGKTYDTRICCLAILLSSVFVYNIMGRLESHIIDELLYVTEMTQHIQSKISDFNMKPGEFISLFLLIIRDFCLMPVVNGKRITSDEYMDKMMFEEENSDVEEKVNNRRKSKRLRFKNRKCFFFPRPTQDDDTIRCLDNIPEENLSKEFTDCVRDFCDCIYNSGSVKKINQTDNILGKNFIKLTHFYVEVIHSGIIPSLESVLAISDKENCQILEECYRMYTQKMTESLTFPVSNDQFMLIHDQCYQDVEKFYFQNIFIDKRCKFYKQLQNYLKQSCKKFQEKNESSSKVKCGQLLQKLFLPVNKKIYSGIYISSGGYKEYKDDISKIKKQYQELPDKGPKADDCLTEFLKRYQLNKEIILLADASLTKKRKDLEEFKSKTEANKKGIQFRAQLLDIFHKHEETLTQAHKEHLKSLRDQYNEFMDLNRMRKLKLLDDQLSVQKKYLLDGFEKRTTELKEKVKKLEEQKKNFKYKMFGKMINITGFTLSLVPYPVYKALGIGLSILSQIMQYLGLF